MAASQLATRRFVALPGPRLEHGRQIVAVTAQATRRRATTVRGYSGRRDRCLPYSCGTVRCSTCDKTHDAGYRAAMGGPGDTDVSAPMAYDRGIVLALAMQKAGPAADNAAISAAAPKIAGPPGQTVTSFVEGKAALNSGHTINYEGDRGRSISTRTGMRSRFFGVNRFHNGALERLYLLK